MVTTCLVDIDGVLADFVGGLYELLGTRKDEALSHHKRPAPYWLPDLLGVPGKEVLKLLEEIDESFWASLRVTPWARKFMRVVEGVFENRIILCTSIGCIDHSSGFAAKAVAGKGRWISTHFPEYCSRVVFCSDKCLLASPSVVLIDDCEETCNDFRALGGATILFPAPWNREHAYEDDPLPRVLEMLRSLRA